MCGITGIIQDSPIDLRNIKLMNDKLVHRGPNGFGYLSSKNNVNSEFLDHHNVIDFENQIHFSFGHRRLSVHDLSEAGHQPMCYKNRYWIVYNGEIYNHHELKLELESKGYVFHSKTDTEIVIASYDFYGLDCLQKFNGDWAFVLIDLEKNKVLITRDRFGVKPLYFYFKKGVFLFASEIKALLANPAVEKKPNHQYLRQYIKYGSHEFLSETAFENIFHFQFSSFFEGSLNDLVDFKHSCVKKYYDFNPNLSSERINIKNLEKYASQYMELLKDAVTLRMQADVPVGATLSGGLDSSSVVCLMKTMLKGQDQLKIFSSVYETDGTLDCDESERINELTEKFELQSNKIEPDINEIPSEHRKMIYYLDTPPNSTLMSSWYTARLVSDKKIVVAITGEGADEQLAGYLRYLMYFFSQLPISDLLSNYKDFKNLIGAKPYLLLGISINFTSKIIGKKITQFIYSLTGRRERLFVPVNQKLKDDIFSMLVDLHHIDERVLMAFSIEQRSPFMDYRLIEFLANVPVTYKLMCGYTKYLARVAFKSDLPESILWNKSKLGWPIPEKFWFEGQLKDWMEENIRNSEFLKKYYLSSSFDFKKMSLHYKIRLLNLAVWYDVFFLN